MSFFSNHHSLTERRRIVLNVVATYGRSLFTLVCGLLSGRWLLQALGDVDLGLYGVVGGLVVFLSFFNGLLSMAVGRFFAVGIGFSKIEGNSAKGLEECQKWFNTALCLHVALFLVLLLVGYPIGAYFVRHVLVIPPDRLDACLWVWRFTCISCFFGMCCVPFSAMYNAKQEIAELTVYQVAKVAADTCFLYYIYRHAGSWLVPYAAWSCLIAVTPTLILSIRAYFRYPECRFRRKSLWDPARMKQILLYAVSRFMTAISSVFMNQGSAVLVNLYMGARFNAAMTFGNQVSNQASMLSSSLSGAFWPAIANKAGEGRADEVLRLSLLTCRIGTLLILVFSIPLSIEIEEVLRLWLKDPPESLSMLCVVFLALAALERMTEGYWMAIMGLGVKVARYSAMVSIAGFSGFLFVWMFFGFGFGMAGLCVSFVIAKGITIAVRLLLGKSYVGLNSGIWFHDVFSPILFLVLCTVTIGLLPAGWLQPSIFRICLTTACCLAVYVPVSWFCVLTDEERALLRSRLVHLCSIVCHARK